MLPAMNGNPGGRFRSCPVEGKKGGQKRKKKGGKGGKEEGTRKLIDRLLNNMMLNDYIFVSNHQCIK